MKIILQAILTVIYENSTMILPLHNFADINVHTRIHTCLWAFLSSQYCMRSFLISTGTSTTILVLNKNLYRINDQIVYENYIFNGIEQCKQNINIYFINEEWNVFYLSFVLYYNFSWMILFYTRASTTIYFYLLYILL